ncbi:MAG TPA: acyl carrier protein, partial [Thermomonospora sp.]|nr:acyl carrier protein [Thermomonospora sp.]
GPSLARRLAALPAAERRRALLDGVREQVAGVLGRTGGGSVNADQAFKEIGFDSMLAVELRNRLAAETGIRLPVTLVFDHPTPRALADRLLTELVPDGDLPEETVPADEPGAPDEIERIAAMDVEDLMSLALGGTSSETRSE